MKPVQLLALALALSGAGAHAYVDPAMPSSMSGNRVVMPATSYSSAWSTSVDGSGVKLGRNFTMAAPGGRTATGAVSSKLTSKAVLTIGARVLATGSGVIGAGVLAYDLYDALRVKPDGSGGLTRDPGQAPQMEEGTCWIVNGVEDCMQPAGVVAYAKEQLTIARGGQECDVRQVILTPSDASMTVQLWFKLKVTNSEGTFCVGNEQVMSTPATKTVSMLPVCPAVTDPYDSAYNIPKGSPVGPDGKCPLGRGSAQPISPEQAADHAAAVERSGDVYKQIMDEILDRAPVPIPKGAQTKVETASPSTIQGPTKSLSGPDGTTQEAVKWDFGRISADLADNFNAGEWKETKTTTTTKPDGTTDTKTETEEGTTPEDLAEENGDQCVLHPDSLGCMDSGTVPEVEPLPVRDVSLDVTPQGGWGAESGSCPAPPVVTVLGQSITVDNSVICSFMGGIKFVVIGVCALIAAGIILGSRKT